MNQYLSGLINASSSSALYFSMVHKLSSTYYLFITKSIAIAIAISELKFFHCFGCRYNNNLFNSLSRSNQWTQHFLSVVMLPLKYLLLNTHNLFTKLPKIAPTHCSSCLKIFFHVIHCPWFRVKVAT